MITGKIFVRNEDGLEAMSETEYAAEADLQKLLAEYPDLLGGDQMRVEPPRRWLLISREAAVPDSSASYGRWSLDHLFLDQDAIPTLVEVKRSTDTRLRREVVGQLLDYAANMTAYWPPARIRETFEETCLRDGRDPSAALAEFLTGARTHLADGGSPETADNFWDKASDHLKARRLRLLFVADLIPTELQRIIEFLNESMPSIEVLGVEVKQYTGQRGSALVPRVIGMTAVALDLKRPPSTSPPLDEASFLASLHSIDPRLVEVAQSLHGWAVEKGLRIIWTKNYMSPQWHESRSGPYHFTFDVSRTGEVSVPFRIMSRRPAFSSREARDELRSRLNAISGVMLEEGVLDGTGRLPLELLGDAAVRERFLDVFEWVLSRVGAGQKEAVEAQKRGASDFGLADGDEPGTV